MAIPLNLSEKLKLFNPDLPLEEASTIPPLWYFDSEIYRAEQNAIFRKNWQMVGRTAQLSEPGQYLTAQIAGESVVVARNKIGEVHAFSNVCRHRGTQILTESSGKASALQCRYHGWTYDLNGALKGTPECEGIRNFSREENGLPRFSVATWGAFVFVNLNSHPIPLTQHLAPLTERTAQIPFEKFQWVKRSQYDIQCNWKVYVDNYLDGGYHINTLHKGLAGVLDYSQYRNELFDFTSLQSSPLVAGKDAAVTNVRRGDRALYWWAFPNFMLNIYDGVMDSNLVIPTGPDSCRVYFDYFFEDTESEAAAAAFIEDSISVAHQVQLEDQEISESVQRGLASATYRAGRFSPKRESTGYHFHRLLAAALR